MTCRKCAQGQMVGPTYVKDQFGSEALTYRCNVCGYSESRPTADQRPVRFGGLLGGYDPSEELRRMREARAVNDELQRQQEAFFRHQRPGHDMKDITPKKQPPPKLTKE